jgi:hypothetical protein
MPAPWAGGALVRIKGEIHGQETVNVLHFATNTVESDVSPPSPLLTALVTAVIECVIETLLDAVTVDWTAKSVDARYIYNTGSSPLTDPVIATAPGGSVGLRGASSVSFAASLVNLRTGVAGRRGRGKMFLPPPGEADMTASDIANDVLLLLAAFGTCMAGKFLGASPTTAWRWGVLSRKTFEQTVGGGFDPAFHIISQISPVAASAVIARRKKGRGD